MQELDKQEPNQKLYKTSSHCQNDTWHVESKHLFKPPKYHITIVNRFNYKNYNTKKYMSLICLDP